VRWWLLVLGGLAVGCSGRIVHRAPATPKAAPRAVAGGHERKVISNGGGVLDSDGAELTIPEGAAKSESEYSITRVAGADLEGWPRGTVVGFAFEPAGQAFRIPVLIELPIDGERGDAMCQTVAGIPVDVPPEDGESNRSHFHVTELPARCVLYAPEHHAAVEAARARYGEVVARQNGRHKWAVQSELCNPNLFPRPNAGRALEEPPGIGGCPLGMAPVPGARACIDRWEAHVVEVLEDGTFHSWSPFFNPGATKIRARSAPGAVPQGYISQIQASQACAEAGKRLCTDPEWVAACRGSQKTQYPYGNVEKAGACNDHRDRHPAIEYLESNDVFAKLEHPCINQLPNSVFLTGAKRECRTPEEVYDLVGNLHEWTADRNGTFRGGYYVEATKNGRGCDYVTTRHDAIYWDYSIGFRCCAEPREGADSIRVAPE
jgi:hypothetical protein